LAATYSTFVRERGCILKLLSVASLTGSIVGLLVSANWVPSAQAAYPCPGGPGSDEIQVGWNNPSLSGGTRVRLCEKNRNGGGSNSGSSAAPQPDPFKAKMDAISSVTSALQGNFAEQERIMKSPKYQAYMRGGWEFFQGKNGAQPGESCTAMFWRKDAIVVLSGPGGDYKGAFLTFFGKDVPRPASVKTINVTLTQNNDAPQTVKAFNFKLPDTSFGSIGLAVPTIEAALAGMEDTIRYDLVTDGKSVVNIEWNGGLAARDKLRKCLSARAEK
jgi:hypothetical protein